MSIVVILLIFTLCFLLCAAFLDYMGFLKIPEVKANTIPGDTYIVYTFQGTLGDLTRYTECALKQIEKSLGKPCVFPKILCFYHSASELNPIASIRFSLLFPVSAEGVSEQLSSLLRHDLFLFTLPTLRVASSSFSYRNTLSYALGQIRIYPFIINFSKQNGITDTSVVVETYEKDQPITYSVVLERTELFNTLRSMAVTSL